jgi:hypothetical protein
MLKKIAIAVLVLVVLVLAYAALQPNSFQVQRTVTIKASPDKIRPLISDFHQWAAWSPWEKLDPAMQRTFSGAPKDLGAVYAWNGNDKVGAGRMEVTALQPAMVVIKLDFLKPYASNNTTTFTLVPQGDGTVVTWSMEGQADFMVKLMSLVASMDKVIGKDFEAGLANLKALAEK